MKDVITTWNNRILELSPKNKTGYKYVSCWYYPKICYTHKLSYSTFDAAHLAAYDYILEKEIRTKYPDGWMDINCPICESNYPPAMEYERTYLHCPISEKDECKRLGGKFDWEEQKWYIPCYIRDHEPFEKWNRSDYGRLPKFEDTSGEIGKITLKTVFLLASEVGDYIGYSPFYLPEQRLNDLHYKYSPETFRGTSKDKQESDIVENNEVVGKLDILTKSNTSAKPVNVLSHEITDLIYNRKPLVSGEPTRLENRFTSCAKTPTVVEKPLVSGEPTRLENRFTQHERDKLGELTPQEKRIVEERLHRNTRTGHGKRLEKQTILDRKKLKVM